MLKRPLSKEALAILSKVTPQNVQNVMLNAVEKALVELRDEGFHVLSEAICACPDEKLRELMGNAMRSAMNLLRFGFTPQRREKMSSCAHLIVTVPFTLSGSGHWNSIDVLKILSSGIDVQMDQLRDPNGAQMPGLVVAVPNKATSPMDLVGLNFILSNPEKNDADQQYFDRWALAGRTTVIANQAATDPEWYSRQAFFYAFAMAVPNMPIREAIDGPLILTDYGQKVLDIIMTSVAQINRTQTDLRVDLMAVRKLSDGITCTQGIAIQKALATVHDSLGSARTQATDPDRLMKIVAGMEFVRRPSSAQLLGVQFVGESGAMLASSRLLLPAGFPQNLADMEVDKFSKKAGVEIQRLPSVELDQYQKNELGSPYVRWVDGQWYDPSLLKAGPKARDILLTGEWAIGWDARIQNSDNPTFLEQLKTLPDPVRQARGGIENVLREHYTKVFLKDFKETIKRPGLSREAAAVVLDEELGYPVLDLLQAGHAMQVLPCQQMYSAAHFAAAGGALFVVRERLMDALAQTDLSDDYPTEAIRIPFPDCYFHFEKPITIDSSDGKSHIYIDGFYVSEETSEADENGPEERRYTIVPITVEADKTFDLTSEAMRIVCSPGDGKSIGESLACVDNAVAEHSEDKSAKAVGSLFKEFMRTMVKVLLYTSLPDQRRREVNSKTDGMTTARQKQGKERQKAMDRASKLYDYISIGPESDEENDLLPSGESKGKSTHVRRGSYVWQPWGPGNSLRRNQWRRPTIVNRDKADEPDKKTYKVG